MAESPRAQSSPPQVMIGIGPGTLGHIPLVLAKEKGFFQDGLVYYFDLSNFRLIDRLIFMRSVEDRGLEEKEFLLKKVGDVQKGRTDKNLWFLLIVQFKIFDKEYNSKLFSEGLLEKEGFFDDWNF